MKTIHLKHLVFMLLISIPIVWCLNACQNTAEKRAEKMIEQAFEGEADVDIEDKKFVVETEEGKFIAEEVKSWPKDIPSSVPEFKLGKIINAMTQTTPEANTWTLAFEEVPEEALEQFKKQLQDEGFKIESTVKMGTNGQVTATKASLTVMLMVGDGIASMSVLDEIKGS
jgi:hypothetical protein